MSSTPKGGPAANIPTSITDPALANLSRKDQRALAKIRQKADNLIRIKSTNLERVKDVCASTKSLDMALKQKPSVCCDDDCHPALNIGNYFKVSIGTSLGNNLHEGCGFIVKTSGVGTVTLFSV